MICAYCGKPIVEDEIFYFHADWPDNKYHPLKCWTLWQIEPRVREMIREELEKPSNG